MYVHVWLPVCFIPLCASLFHFEKCKRFSHGHVPVAVVLCGEDKIISVTLALHLQWQKRQSNKCVHTHARAHTHTPFAWCLMRYPDTVDGMLKPKSDPCVCVHMCASVCVHACVCECVWSQEISEWWQVRSSIECLLFLCSCSEHWYSSHYS